MATTTNWGIVYPVVGNTITPLATQFANLANSTDTALTTATKNSGTTPVADATARGTLFPSPVNGNSVYRLDTKAVEIYNGTAWLSYDNQAVSFTPSWTGITIGNGTTGGYYVREGAIVQVEMWIKFGTTTSFPSSAKVALPITPVVVSPVIGSAYWEIVGAGTYHQPGVGFGLLTPIMTSASAPHVELFGVNTASTYAGFNSMNGTTPVTFANGGGITLNLNYKIA